MPGQVFLQEHQGRHGEESLAGQEKGVAAIAQEKRRGDEDGTEQGPCQGGAEGPAQGPSRLEAEEDQFTGQDGPEKGRRPGHDDEGDEDQGSQ